MLSEGLDVLVHVDACGAETFHGFVDQVAQVPNSASWPNINVKEYTTTIRLTDDIEKLATLKPGMTAEVEIMVDRLESVLQAPIQSCVERGGRYFAWVQDDDSDLTRHEIQLGKSNDVAAEIVAGLAEGEKVVLNPRSVLADEVALLEQEFAVIEEPAPQNDTAPPRPVPARAAPVLRELEKAPGKSDDNDNRPHEKEKPPGSLPGSPGDRQPATVLIMASLPDSGKTGGRAADDPMSVFNRLDRNHDAKVSESELPDPMKQVLPRLDTNGDHVIDRAEWKKGTCTVPAHPEG
jgi:HlyD family secretion protein